jgi:hypothetical protein
MSDGFSCEFLLFEVNETSESLGHWLDHPWVDEGQRPRLLKASILALPDAGSEEGPVFPVGTAEFIERLREALGTEATLAVAIRSDDYQELSLRSKAWRMPTRLLSAGIVPVALNILGNHKRP